MIGDDIVNDVGGAQQCGMRALQVRTGKYRSVHIISTLHPIQVLTAKPDAIMNCNFSTGICH